MIRPVTMDMIKVDPKLFVTCRLCLEDLGQYQIVPAVQKQIKYCFDIEVESFDGLPQLICLKCKEILNQFNELKTKFCEKQINLKNNVLKPAEIYAQPQQDTVSSSQQTSEQLVESKKIQPKKKRIIQSSSSSDVESEKSYHVSKPKQRKTFLREKTSMPWQANYKKQLVCKICNSMWSSKISFWNHVRVHDILRAKYKNILNKQCKVNLIKIDDLPNITGVNNMVVHNNNKIVAPGESYFYTIYIKEHGTGNHLEDIQPEVSNISNSSQDSTDDEEILSKRNQRRRRLVSRSSNETVVIESNGNKILSEKEEEFKLTRASSQRSINSDQCINIDDSSDSDSDKGIPDSNQRIKYTMEAQLVDYKIIQGIISMCVNAYYKRNEFSDVETYMNVLQNKNVDGIQMHRESQLKHKILSIGRKVITKQGFNCTGMLRFLEYKNLEIIWLVKPIFNFKETNYVRILTKRLTKAPGSQTTNENLEWINCKCVEHDTVINRGPSNNNSVQAVSWTSGPAIHSVHDTSILQSTNETNQVTIIETSQLPSTEADQSEQDPSDTDGAAILYFDCNASNSDMKKLLNANPVANPKQLPKKLGQGNESRPNKIAQLDISHTNDNSNFCMPIITSTTSLATGPTKEHKEDSDYNKIDLSAVTSNTETYAPRIKVKPASELMSERVLNNYMQQPIGNDNMLASPIENVWSQPQPVNIYTPNLGQQLQVTSQPIQIVQIPCVNLTPTYQILPSPATTSSKKEFVVLDSVEFPNTETQSPFQYLKDILHMHNLVLLDPCDSLSRDFNCLIKFKVLFKQEADKDNQRTTVLCLSLYCFRNHFCLKIRDRNQENININKISPNWQWEILQIYREKVVAKVLQNAKKFSQETYDFTNSFFCLLKSINLKKTS